jgi:plasmid stabilization system protein ParE
MNNYRIVFSPRAQQRLEEIADYLYQQHLSNQFVVNYLQRFEDWLITLLSQFPESGTLMPEFGDDVRRVVYQKYSFVYRINGNAVEILTLYRENRP